jgi:hypothetical protein
VENVRSNHPSTMGVEPHHNITTAHPVHYNLEQRSSFSRSTKLPYSTLPSRTLKKLTMAAPAESSFRCACLPNGRNVELCRRKVPTKLSSAWALAFSANLNESDGPVAMSRKSLPTDYSQRGSSH